MLNILIWAIVIVVVLGGAVAVIVAGIGASRRNTEDDPLMARLADATQRGDVVQSIEQIEMQQPFSERVLLPLLRPELVSFSTRFTPQKALEDTQRKLNSLEIRSVMWTRQRCWLPVLCLPCFWAEECSSLP